MTDVSKTNTDRIEELFKIAHTLTERVDSLREEMKGVWPDVGKVTDAVGKIETRLALIEQQLIELKQWKDQQGLTDHKSEINILKEQVKNLQETVDRAGNRLWSVVPNILGAIVSGIIAAIVAYYIAKH